MSSEHGGCLMQDSIQAVEIDSSERTDMPPQPTQEKIHPLKGQREYYRPAATKSPALVFFLISACVFLAGLEYVLRRGVPVPPNESVTGRIQQRDLGVVPFGSRQIAIQPTCIGVEIIVSIQKSITVTYQKPIFDKALPTMPCYVCAMHEQGIVPSGWITASTVSL